MSDIDLPSAIAQPVEVTIAGKKIRIRPPKIKEVAAAQQYIKAQAIAAVMQAGELANMPKPMLNKRINAISIEPVTLEDLANDPTASFYLTWLMLKDQDPEFDTLEKFEEWVTENAEEFQAETAIATGQAGTEEGKESGNPTTLSQSGET